MQPENVQNVLDVLDILDVSKCSKRFSGYTDLGPSRSETYQNKKTYKNQDIRFIDSSTISPLCKRSLSSMHFKAREATVHDQFPPHHLAELAL